MLEHFRLSHVVAGFVSVLVGYASSAVIVLQAAAAAGATEAQQVSFLWVLGVGMGVATIALSLRYRAPVLAAWSTSGAALLVTALAGATLGEAVGAYGERLSDPAEVEPAIARCLAALDSGRSAVLNVQIGLQ